MENIGSEKYKHCNHHHELTKDHAILKIDGNKIVANKEAIPLLKALNNIGLKTRTHHVSKKGYCFVSIILDNAEFSFKEVFESATDRTMYNGKKELLISWKR